MKSAASAVALPRPAHVPAADLAGLRVTNLISSGPRDREVLAAVLLAIQFPCLPENSAGSVTSAQGPPDSRPANRPDQHNQRSYTFWLSPYPR
jgi:hypothetical protein